MDSKIVFTDLSSIVKEVDRDADKAYPSTFQYPEWIVCKYKEARAEMDEAMAKDGVFNLNHQAYSQILLSHRFWEKAIYEDILLFQTDAWLCKPGLNAIIDDHGIYIYIYIYI